MPSSGGQTCARSEEHTSELQSHSHLVCRLLLEKKTSDPTAQPPMMHVQSIWYTMIGPPTKPSFRSGNFALARIDYERINGFDEQFIGWGCEDDDFGRRLRAAGVRAVSILNRTRVYHLWHP